VEVAPKAQPLRLLETSVLLAPNREQRKRDFNDEHVVVVVDGIHVLFLVPSISYGWVTVNGAAIPEVYPAASWREGRHRWAICHVQPSGLGMGWRFRVDGAFHWDTWAVVTLLVAMR